MIDSGLALVAVFAMLFVASYTALLVVIWMKLMRHNCQTGG